MNDAGYPIIDVHQHSGPWPFAGKWGGIEQNLHYLAARGIDAAIISSGEAIEAARQVPSLHLDFALSTAERGRIERAIAALGPERVMFGSDATLLDPLYMLSCFAEADIGDQDRPPAMGGNALRVLGLDLPISPP